VYDCRDRYWRIRYSNQNWEELTRREMEQLKSGSDYRASSAVDRFLASHAPFPFCLACRYTVPSLFRALFPLYSAYAIASLSRVPLPCTDVLSVRHSLTSTPCVVSPRNLLPVRRSLRRSLAPAPCVPSLRYLVRPSLACARALLSCPDALIVRGTAQRPELEGADQPLYGAVEDLKRYCAFAEEAKIFDSCPSLFCVFV